MKLKCVKHAKRVVVIGVYDKATTIHRDTGTKCDSEVLTIGGRNLTPRDVLR